MEFDLSDFTDAELLDELTLRLDAMILFGGQKVPLPPGATAAPEETPDDESFVLSEVSNREICGEIQARLESPDKRFERAHKILECAARIAFGDYTDLPRLKFLFNDVGVYGTSSGQLAFLLEP